MPKETYYFSHDYEPTSDPKIIALIGEYGAIGYGVYWRIVEMLHSDENHKLPAKNFIYAAIGSQMKTPVNETIKIITYCIDVCELFTIKDGFFWSDRVFRNIEKKDKISIKRSNAGKKSAEQRATSVEHVSTSVEHVLTLAEQTSTSVQQNPTKERKGKEIKGKEIDYVEDKRVSEIFEQLKRVTVNYSNEYLFFQSKLLLNAYPDVIPVKAAKLVNTWASNIRPAEYKTWLETNSSQSNGFKNPNSYV